MTTSPKKPGTGERIARNLACMTMNFNSQIIDLADMEYLEKIIPRPVMLTWIATILNRRSTKHHNHYFYNQDNHCLDYYSITDPPEKDGSKQESETRNE